MNFGGIIVGAAVFLIIGICHPIVIKMEYHWGKKSWWVLALAGCVFGVASLFVADMIGATILGAAAFSCFWGIHEILAQEMRVLRGWFPKTRSATRIMSGAGRNWRTWESSRPTRISKEN